MNEPFAALGNSFKAQAAEAQQEAFAASGFQSIRAEQREFKPALLCDGLHVMCPGVVNQQMQAGCMAGPMPSQVCKVGTRC
jgi:hypothetical protein